MQKRENLKLVLKGAIVKFFANLNLWHCHSFLYVSVYAPSGKKRGAYMVGGTAARATVAQRQL